MTWKHIAASVTGSSHKNRNEAGQDYCRAQVLQFADREFFVGLAADGAGSTREGGTGAKIACDTILSAIADDVRLAGDLAQVPDDAIGRWITASRDAVAAQAQQAGKPIREYACTLVGCVADAGCALCFQIGDGGIVLGCASGYTVVFWPDQGEYANTTFFVTDENFSARISRHRTSAPPEEIALFTDGLQNLVLSFSQKAAHAGFFRPLFETLRKTPSPESLMAEHLRTFLTSREINERSDDDKTLVLAVR